MESESLASSSIDVSMGGTAQPPTQPPYKRTDLLAPCMLSPKGECMDRDSYIRSDVSRREVRDMELVRLTSVASTRGLIHWQYGCDKGNGNGDRTHICRCSTSLMNRFCQKCFALA